MGVRGWWVFLEDAAYVTGSAGSWWWRAEEDYLWVYCWGTLFQFLYCDIVYVINFQLLLSFLSDRLLWVIFPLRLEKLIPLLNQRRNNQMIQRPIKHNPTFPFLLLLHQLLKIIFPSLHNIFLIYFLQISIEIREKTISLYIMHYLKM